MLELIMCQGCPASGKSTWTKEQVLKSNGKYKRVNKDDLRAMLDCGKWSKEREKYIVGIRDKIISEALSQNISVIVDDTNFAPVHEQVLKGLASKYNAQFSIRRFDVPLDECIKRDLARPNSVGAKVIRDMYFRYAVDKSGKVEFIEGLRPAIVCDLDGTLALFDHHRGPFDASNAHMDKVNEPVSMILNLIDNQGYGSPCIDVILLSGREDKYRIPTELFLKNNKIPYDALHMRATDDNRKDYIIKRELFDKHIRGQFNVLFWLDDRNQVVDMVRHELGIPCFQVNEGDF
jgi:predicted kinase